MYIPSLCLSKISVIVFVKSIIEVFRNNRSIWMVISGITLWGVAAEIVTALQSHVPRPWGYLDGKCVQMVRVESTVPNQF